MVSVTKEVNEILQSLSQYSPNNTENVLETLQASAMAVRGFKDILASLEPNSLTPLYLGLEPLFDRLTRELANAENSIKSIEGFVFMNNKHTKTEAVARIGQRQRILSSQQDGSWINHPRKPSITVADYHFRSQSRHLLRGYNIGKGFESQQGYRPARQSRQDSAGGQHHRRLNHANGQCAATTGDEAYGLHLKQEQCIRLAECAGQYNMYDLFIYFFGDDIDFGTGSLDDRIVSSTDLSSISAKVRTVHYYIYCAFL